MKTSRKVVASLAVVGTIAAVALFNVAHNNTSSASTFLAEEPVDTEVLQLFNEFISHNQKSFLTKDEYSARLQIFKQNYNEIKQVNGDKSNTFEIGLNRFADLTQEEYEKELGLKNLLDPEDEEFYEEENRMGLEEEGVKEEEAEGEEGRNLQSVPASLDWRQKGAVLSIKNQGSCGGCYTFAAADAMAGAYKIKTGKLVDMSVQQLLDCTRSYGNAGCGGGLMTNCYNYLKTAKIMTWSSYPYTGRQGSCRYQAAQGVVGTSGYVNVARNDPNAMKQAVAKTPVSIGIASSSSVYRFYKNGILNSSSCGTGLNHANTIVGYGTQNGQGYWIIKNSWGTGWGEKGYVRIAMTT